DDRGTSDAERLKDGGGFGVGDGVTTGVGPTARGAVSTERLRVIGAGELFSVTGAGELLSVTGAGELFNVTGAGELFKFGIGLGAEDCGVGELQVLVGRAGVE